MSDHVYIALGGVPATGKSTLCWGLIKKLRETYSDGEPSVLRLGVAEGLFFAHARVLLLGKWQHNHPFPGPDRLSMAVQPVMMELLSHATGLIDHLNALDADAGLPNRVRPLTVVADGDRLYNDKMFGWVAERMTLKHLVLKAGPLTLQSRHKARADTQKETFLKSRATKVQNMMKKWPATVLTNGSPEDAERNLETLWRCMAGNAPAALEARRRG